MAVSVSWRRAIAGLACILLALGSSPRSLAEGASFDLAGPSLRIAVEREGSTLPLSRVPDLSPGDRLKIEAQLPADQSARYRLVVAFLRGATNPPPEKWLSQARTWKPAEAVLNVSVPEGAQQAIVFLVPDTGGAFKAVGAAVRQRPGAFVRASQDLNRAMLDRARLEAFLTQIRNRSTEQIAQVSPVLARSLGVKLDPSCIERRQDLPQACLTQGQTAAVLADGQTSSIAQTLADAPANIALQLSATPQAGFGYYSAYVGVFRDLARMLGAFQSAQLQFIPALNLQRRDHTELLLNTVPSFRKPQSVLVAALPPVAPPSLPPIEATGDRPLCIARPGLALPVIGAPLVFATDYARNMRLRVTTRAGVRELTVTPDPALGGFIVSSDQIPSVAFEGAVEGTLHGDWGFAPFDGPRFRLTAPAAADAWRAGDATLVVGRDTPIALTGGAAACVAEVRMQRGSRDRPVPFEVKPGGTLALKVPLTDEKPGKLVLAIRSFGLAQSQRLDLRAYAEPSRVSGFTLHDGDRHGVLTGTRLDQIQSLDLAGVRFQPEVLTREGAVDRLGMKAEAAPIAAASTTSGVATLTDGRTVSVPVKIAAARPDAALLGMTIETIRPEPVSVKLKGRALVPQNARLTFSLRMRPGMRFEAQDAVEVRAGETVVSLPLRMQDAGTAIATLDPAALGDAAHGAVQYRVVRTGAEGDWRPIATLVRVPQLTAITCHAKTCVLTGKDLFLLRSVAGAVIPDGFTGSSVTFKETGEATTVSLRDEPAAEAVLSLPDPSQDG